MCCFSDSWWCLQDNYTFAQPGIQKKVKALEELVSRMDGQCPRVLGSSGLGFLWPRLPLTLGDLCGCVVSSPEDIHGHLLRCEVEYLQFAFRWMNNLLMRELPLRCTIRLWDTYQVPAPAPEGGPGSRCPAGSFTLHSCVCQAEAEGFSHFHLYVCAAFLLEWRKQILSMSDFQVPLFFAVWTSRPLLGYTSFFWNWN